MRKHSEKAVSLTDIDNLTNNEDVEKLKITSEAYEKVGKSGIPTAVIWGTDDSTVPFNGSKKVKKAIPQAKIFPIDGAGHSVTYARSAAVNKILLEVLKP